MRWQRKAAIQSVLSRIPFGESLYYLLQRHVTGTLPPSEEKFEVGYEVEARHLEVCRKFGSVPVEEAIFFQFGAGWTLGGPLTFHALGVDRQILVDIRRLVRPALINRSIEYLQTLDLRPQPVRLPRHLLGSRIDRAVAQLREHYGIDYRAPADARATSLPDNSVDYVTSTNTLEHIPGEDIAGILAECHRILKPGGVMSFRVDYQDHYSYFDGSLSVYNFLQYSDEEWRAFNPSLHYQNRMRHSDYLKLYGAAGFEVADEEGHRGDSQDLKTLAGIRLHERYQDYTPDDLSVRWSDIALKKPVSAELRVKPAA